MVSGGRLGEHLLGVWDLEREGKGVFRKFVVDLEYGPAPSFLSSGVCLFRRP